jgi:hypothetical protein
MKPRSTTKTPKKFPARKELNALPAKGSKKLLRRGTGKKRATISPSAPHSKTFGH